MYIFVRTITGNTLCINDYDSKDTIVQFREKCKRHVIRENAPSIRAHREARRELVFELLLVKERINRLKNVEIRNETSKVVVGFLNKISCNGLWREICQFVFPLKDVPKPFLPTYPFSPITHNFRIIVQGTVPGDEDLCNGWNQLTVIHLVPIPKE